MKTVLVTGANRGIGLEHARRYASRGVKVYATSRDPDSAEDLDRLAAEKKGLVTVLPYDAANGDAPRKLKAAIGDAPLDLLLANAGMMGDRKGFGSTSADNIMQVFAINAVAPLKLAEAFADNVAASDRKLIAFQSSKMGSIDDNGSGGSYSYRLGKVGLNMVARTVARDLASRGIVAVALHPGWVKTRMGGPSGLISVEQCVEAQQRLFDKLTPAMSGRFWNYDGAEIPW